VHWLQELDLGLLRFFNQTLSNPVFDVVMPFLSGNAFFFPAIVIAGIAMLWKGEARARICLLMIILIVGPGDGFVINTIKSATGRARPYVTHSDIRQPGAKAPPQLKSSEDAEITEAVADVAPRKASRRSMPSAHAANWFCATTIFFIYFRRSLWFFLPLACLIAFSRLYNGVHYPGDVLLGAIVGAGYGAAGVWLFNALWQAFGRRWFPIWWNRLPSLIRPAVRPSDDSSRVEATASEMDAHWLRLGYVVITVLLLLRISYISGGEIQLSGDEAYQWTWSKHLALSYFSKPPMIALTQWLGTQIWGDTELGVRFFSPVLAAAVSLLLLQFFRRHVSSFAGFVLLLVSSTTPLLSVGATLMTIDPLLVFFWTLAMVAGWRATQPHGRTSDWAWAGLWMGLGFLSKYTALLQWLCWAVFFIAWKPARVHLQRPGPYVALLVNALCTLPVIIWNAQRDWITVVHVADNAGLDRRWNPRTFEFLGVEFALLNPIFFVGAIWASIAVWKRMRTNPLAIFLFSMGTPLFLVYFFWSFRTRILPNWIAPAILPMFCLMVLYWRDRWPEVCRWARPALTFGISLGAFAVVLMHEADLVSKFAGRPLPPKMDPMTRVRSYSDSGRVIERLRQEFRKDGQPVFIICGHYQQTGLFSFYIDEAKTNVSRNPVVYAERSSTPKNQYFFWPGYRDQRRRGENALFVRELGGPPLVDGWFFKWLGGETNLLLHSHRGKPAPASVLEDFESVTELGQFHARYRGRIFHTYQVFECRSLK